MANYKSLQPNPARILVIAMRHPGDMLLTIPLLHWLKQAYPDSQLNRQTIGHGYYYPCKTIMFRFDTEITPVKWASWSTVFLFVQNSLPLKAGRQQLNNLQLCQGNADGVPCHLEGCDKHPKSRGQSLDSLSPVLVKKLIKQVLGYSSLKPQLVHEKHERHKRNQYVVFAQLFTLWVTIYNLVSL